MRSLSRPARFFLWLSTALLCAVALAACGGGDDGDVAVGAESPDAASATEPAPADSAEPDAAEPDAAESEPEPAAVEPDPATAEEPTADEPEPAEAEDVASQDEPAPADNADGVTPVVFNGNFGESVAPVLSEKCASCHSPGGPGTAHWTLDSAQDAVDTHLLIAGVVETGYMPPWPAGGDSVEFSNDRSLTDDEMQAILDWADAGGEIDVEPATALEPTSGLVRLLDADMELLPPEPYAGDPSNVDDYRCLIYDPQLPDGGWITDYEFVPDQTEVVHHAIGYMIEASRRDRAFARDGEDGRPGWQCYGSSGLGGDDIFLGWAPGQEPSSFPEGTGLWVEPGGLIVIQIHYHYEGSAPADSSSLALNVEPAEADLAGVIVSEMIAPAEIPCSADEVGPLCDRDAALADAIERFGPEGVRADAFMNICGWSVEDFATMTDGIAYSSCDIPAFAIGATGQILSILGHEHEIGSSLKVTLNPGAENERVLLDIPKWDFDWQYNYVPTEEIIIGPADIIRLECSWDRALRDPRLEPAYILWADGTNDEMCFGTVTTIPVS